MDMNKFIAAESSSDGGDKIVDKEEEAPDKEMPGDKDEGAAKPEPELQERVVPTSIQHERAEQVTSKLLELQQKHKEISERVQNVLIDTVDFAFGASQTGSLKDAIQTITDAESAKTRNALFG